MNIAGGRTLGSEYLFWAEGSLHGEVNNASNRQRQVGIAHLSVRQKVSRSFIRS